MKNKTDIFAVAKRAKVSISTVSRTFNHPEQVKPATRKKIDKAVRELGYIRNRAAQTMHGIRSGTIGLVVPTIDHTIFAELIQAFSQSVEAHGFVILVASHGYDLEREYAAVRKFLEHRVDGVALIGQDHSEETYQLLDSNKTPAISIWNYDEASRLSCVGADNALAGQLAAQCLLDHGHRDIGLMFPPRTDNDRARGRYEGACRALVSAGVTLREGWMTESLYSLSEAKHAVASILTQPQMPTALLCGNDVLAVGALYGAQDMGLGVPDDLSIIGIGDFKGSEEMSPALTTVRLPAREIGHLAGQQLAGFVVGNLDQTVRINCAITLNVRDTCQRR
ncbi:LacI family DNA-binding transcriptional regulator [Roseobacter sp. YSTF-M11]|uniref:LacI family DNA-binding transcriptional regulator n=1 Tax=Roseobacter insulae TaxID=2859783 RepID=A0A9X1FTJ2_9RHOB|nr:LacI family DNA-binding transcriptional regulator [Roseobacter insulae]MBW4706643.1 LacI family DNA-binding transcriptional regulator [Roseobacter insulae]